MSSGVAGGVGLLVMIPLSLAALVSVPVGIYLSVLHRKDLVLPLLSVLTVLWLAEVVTEAGTVAFYNATAWVYAIAALAMVASWFLVRRARAYAAAASEPSA